MATARPQLVFPHVRLPDFLPAGEAQALLDWTLAELDAFAPSRLHYGTEAQGATRVSVSRQDLGPAAKPLKTALKARLPELFAGLGMQAFKPRLEMELVAHNDGAMFSPHIDTGMLAGHDRLDRRVSAVYYFHRAPKRFEGGALRLHSMPAGRSTDIAPDHNTLVAFPSFAPHEVLRVSCPSRRLEDSRFAVNLWLHGPAS